MTESPTTTPADTVGWKYFNTSSEEWEWGHFLPQKCDGDTKIQKCTYGKFCEEFPYHG